MARRAGGASRTTVFLPDLPGAASRGPGIFLSEADMTREQRDWQLVTLLTAAAAGAALALVLGWSAPAAGHEWNTNSCCSGRDCTPGFGG
jgi:hypothetical protein